MIHYVVIFNLWASHRSFVILNRIVFICSCHYSDIFTDIFLIYDRNRMEWHFIRNCKLIRKVHSLSSVQMKSTKNKWNGITSRVQTDLVFVAPNGSSISHFPHGKLHRIILSLFFSFCSSLFALFLFDMVFGVRQSHCINDDCCRIYFSTMVWKYQSNSVCFYAWLARQNAAKHCRPERPNNEDRWWWYWF